MQITNMLILVLVPEEVEEEGVAVGVAVDPGEVDLLSIGINLPIQQSRARHVYYNVLLLSSARLA